MLRSRFQNTLCVLLMIVGAQSVFAQNYHSSPYSIYGLGAIYDRTSSLNRGMASTGIGVQDAFNLNYRNPASYVWVTPPISHIFEMGIYVEANRYKTDNGAESKNNGGMSNLSYWFKFSPKWASVLGISPYSGVSYNIKSTQNVGTGEIADYVYEGSGNITQLYFGNSYMPIKNLSLGINACYLFGSIKRNESLQSPTLPAVYYENKIFTNKFDFDFGVQYRIPLKKNALVVGLIADDGLTLTGESKGKLYTSNGDTLANIAKDDVHYELPKSFGGGLSWNTPLAIYAVDLKYQGWSDVKFSEGGLTDQSVTTQDTWRISGGYMYKGSPDAESYFGLVSIRGGVYYEDYYLKMKGISIPNWGVSAGLSFPIFDNRSSLNLNYSFDRIGTQSHNLILQSSQKFQFDVILRDLWGGKRRVD